jgi:hypothetical protein
MTNRSNHQNGYNKKELIEIIEKIDADQNQMKKQTEKPNTYEHPVDSCNHLISTSLRDLSSKYQNLSSKK